MPSPRRTLFPGPTTFPGPADTVPVARPTTAEVPHFRFPFERTMTGPVAVVEQDTPEHVMCCEHVIVRCPIGFRTEKPEFGWAFPEFRNAPLDLSELESALRRWEPRGRASAREWADEASFAVRNVEVEVRS